MDNQAKKQLDASILREHSISGDTKGIAEKHGVSMVYALRLINEARLAKERAHAPQFASSVMTMGDVVYALPANQLHTNTGTTALINELMKTIASVDSSMNVMVAIALIPVEEINITQLPFEHPRATAASLQACAVNTAHKAGAI